MRAYMLNRLSDRELLRDLVALVAQDRATTAALLAHVAEVDSRQLYLPAGYPSMYAYCVQELRLSEDAAYKRIQAARTAQQFPALFTALADGRLHLSAVNLLAPYLTLENADELLGAAARKSKAEIELLLAQRFPRTEMLPMVQGLPASGPRPQEQLAPGQVEAEIPAFIRDRGDEHAPGHVAAPLPHLKVAPLSAESFALHLTMSKDMHEKLRYAQALMSHQIPSGDLAQVLDRALDALISKLEKHKFAATKRPRTGPRRKTTSQRHIPAHVKRAVWERDRGRCTFVSQTGHRCSARRFLEFDHEDPVARGGQATVERMRLRCRAHNQYEAERAFGASFMIDKREAARRGRESARASAAERAQAAAAERVCASAAEPVQAAAAEQAQAAAAERAQAAETARDVMAALRTLGFRADESRRATAFSESLAGASLEERVRLALSCFRPRAYSRTPAPPSLSRAP